MYIAIIKFSVMIQSSSTRSNNNTMANKPEFGQRWSQRKEMGVKNQPITPEFAMNKLRAYSL